MTYRPIATISICSAGAVAADLREMKAEKEKTIFLEAPLEKPELIEKAKNICSNFHEIGMPNGEVNLELEFAS